MRRRTERSLTLYCGLLAVLTVAVVFCGCPADADGAGARRVVQEEPVKEPFNVTITFDGNGHTYGTVPDPIELGAYDEYHEYDYLRQDYDHAHFMVSDLPMKSLFRPGYRFAGWDRNKDAVAIIKENTLIEGVEFPNYYKFTGWGDYGNIITSDLTLYAIWIDGMANIRVPLPAAMENVNYYQIWCKGNTNESYVFFTTDAAAGDKYIDIDLPAGKFDNYDILLLAGKYMHLDHNKVLLASAYKLSQSFDKGVAELSMELIPVEFNIKVPSEVKKGASFDVLFEVKTFNPIVEIIPLNEYNNPFGYFVTVCNFSTCYGCNPDYGYKPCLGAKTFAENDCSYTVTPDHNPAQGIYSYRMNYTAGDTMATVAEFLRNVASPFSLFNIPITYNNGWFGWFFTNLSASEDTTFPWTGASWPSGRLPKEKLGQINIID